MPRFLLSSFIGAKSSTALTPKSAPVSKPDLGSRCTMSREPARRLDLELVRGRYSSVPKCCRRFGEARRVAPFIVVPGRDRDEMALLHLGQGQINNRRMIVADDAR